MTITRLIIMNDFLDLWLENRKDHVTKERIIIERRIVRDHIRPYYKSYIVAEIRPSDISGFYKFLQLNHVSPNIIATVSSIMKNLFYFAMRKNIIKTNPCDKAIKVSQPPTVIIPYSDNEIKKLILAICESRYRNLYLFTLATGLKSGEVFGATWDCYEEEQHLFYVRQRLKLIDSNYKVKGEFHAGTFNGYNHTIFLSSFAIAILRDTRTSQLKYKIDRSSSWVEHDYIFTEQDGFHVSIANLYRHNRIIREKVGVSYFNLTLLRNAYAMYGFQSGANLKTMMDSFGIIEPKNIVRYWERCNDSPKALNQRTQEFYANLMNIKNGDANL